MTDHGLLAEHLALAYGARRVIDELDLAIPRGRVTAIVGANACGKSTLLRAFGRLLRPAEGTVVLDGEAIARLPTREVARRLAILPQTPLAPEGLTVADLVARGRYPHQRLFRQWSRDDARAIDEALRATGVDALADRPLDELSGGQRQRAWIAMVLAQDTDILLLDEPTTYLDMAHQLEVLDLLADLNTERGRTVVMVLHDLNQACRYADHLVALRDGRVQAAGPPTDIVDEALIEQVFGLRCRIISDPTCGAPLCLPLTREGRASPSRPGAVVR